jgi:hypothetical protein
MKRLSKLHWAELFLLTERRNWRRDYVVAAWLVQDQVIW